MWKKCLFSFILCFYIDKNVSGHIGSTTWEEYYENMLFGINFQTPKVYNFVDRRMKQYFPFKRNDAISCGAFWRPVRQLYTGALPAKSP